MAINIFNLYNGYPLMRSELHTPKINYKKLSCSLKPQNSHPAYERRFANYQPTAWSYNFLQSLNNDNADVLYKDKARKLEEKVRSVINDESKEVLTILELIDDIQRLGLAYLFEKDIKKVLDRFYALGGFNLITNKSLHATALIFRLLRQHGYEVYQDEFKDFMDEKGNLSAKFIKDVKGMLSLYEVSFLAFGGEDFLNNAMAQTRIHLKNLETNSKLDIMESVSHALELPLQRRMVLLEARWYIELYNKKEDANNFLLQLAKLNFNMVQSILQKDLKDMSRWWLGLADKLRFSRDRLVECFFWTVGMAFEPQFCSCRKGLTKVTSFITTIDDVYDVYGALDELKLFTDAVERWDINALKDLPDYMKLCFLALYNTVNEMAYDTLKEHGVNITPYLAKAWADLCKAFLQEAKWRHNKLTPTFNEYIENGWRSVSGTVILIHAYFLMDQNNSKQELNSFLNYHQLLKWPSIIFRLYNDLVTSSDELIRGENGVSEEEARKHINNLIDEAWKKMNEYQNGETHFAKSFLEAAVNLARISQCTYQYGDSHGAPDNRSKRKVLSLIIEPISISEN